MQAQYKKHVSPCSKVVSERRDIALQVEKKGIKIHFILCYTEQRKAPRSDYMPNPSEF